MLRNRTFIVLATVLILAISLNKLIGADEEARITKRLENLQTLASLEVPENRLQALASATEIGKFFAEDISLSLTSSLENEETREYRISGKQELTQRLAALRLQASKLEIKLDVDEIEIEGDLATIKVKAAALGSLPGVEGEFFDLHLVEIKMIESSDDWIIKSVKHLENLRD